MTEFSILSLHKYLHLIKAVGRADSVDVPHVVISSSNYLILRCCSIHKSCWITVVRTSRQWYKVVVFVSNHFNDQVVMRSFSNYRLAGDFIKNIFLEV